MKNKAVNVLICDYHEAYSTELARRLNQHGLVNVLGSTRSVSEAASYLSFATPDILLVDVHKLVVEQPQKVREIKKKHPDLQLIALELYEEELSRNDLSQHGFDAVVARNAELETIETEMLLSLQKKYLRNSCDFQSSPAAA
jgi:DNA-binding NarL/FixJ family response regulator